MTVDDLESRRALLAEGNRLYAEYLAVGSKGMDLFFRATELHTRYRDSLPTVTVSRCPITGQLARRAMDVVDFDGWYWKSPNPLRPPAHRAGRWLAMSGATRLVEPVTAAPFDAMPGPDLPFVVPGMLARPDTYAVLSEVPIGRHTGWAVNYFGPRAYPLIHEWGTDKNDLHDPIGYWCADVEYDRLNLESDFDLLPWLESGQLRWIAPGDTEFTLSSGAADCPYLGLEGEGCGQVIRDGGIHRYRFRG